jgi:NAD+ synthase (glutamine-hydrolysing)
MFRIALAQINSTVGDIRNNTRKIISYIKKARNRMADIVIFPELAITGYPPEDLLYVPEFIKYNLSALDEIRKSSQRISVIVGFVGVDKSESLYNSAAIISNQKVVGIYNKTHLSNYGVFDEKRYFRRGREQSTFRLLNTSIGVNICEDIWVDNGPIEKQVKQGKARIIINISASPFHIGKYQKRCEILSRRARNNKVYIAYVNLVGGQDELVFDGRSMAFDPSGQIIARAKSFNEELFIVDIPLKKKDFTYVLFATWKSPEVIQETYEALKLGLSDYVRKNGFRKVIIGLSGGIDSALTSLIAVDALGRNNVSGLYLPSQFSSSLSNRCTATLTRNLGIKLITIPINHIYQKYLMCLKLSRKTITLTNENLQSRIRGNILMALSNKTGALVLTTGNKSELSTGYTTLYGDMAGGFALLKDVPKTLVYKLVSYGNYLFSNKINKFPIPEEIIKRAPSAELKPNQKDSDTLPEYEILDPILQAYIEENKNLKQIVKQTGIAEEVVSKVMRMVDRSEYKRRQFPPGVKITPCAFGKDRRFPITNKFFLSH